MEFVLPAGLDLPGLRQNISAAGSGDDDPAGGRIETQPAVDADRRRGPSGKMVFRTESEFAGVGAERRGDEPPDRWAGAVAMEVVKGGAQWPREASSFPPGTLFPMA